MAVYKTKLHIPTREYEFVEIEIEGTPEEIKESYEDIRKEFEGGDGLPHNEWCRVVEDYLQGKPLDPDTYERMDKYQKGYIQETKRAFNRISSKNK